MITLLQRMKWFAVLALLQVLVLNRVHIQGYATPFLCVYFLFMLDSGTKRNTLLGWGFALGLTVDIFGNTPGMNAAAATLLAFVREPLLRLVTLRDTADDFEPGIRSMGVLPYLRFITLGTLLFVTVFQVLDVFRMMGWAVLAGRIVSDVVVSVTCMMCLEFIRDKKVQ
jgi:rod shape-determining protein MreD